MALALRASSALQLLGTRRNLPTPRRHPFHLPLPERLLAPLQGIQDPLGDLRAGLGSQLLEVAQLLPWVVAGPQRPGSHRSLRIRRPLRFSPPSVLEPRQQLATGRDSSNPRC